MWSNSFRSTSLQNTNNHFRTRMGTCRALCNSMFKLIKVKTAKNSKGLNFQPFNPLKFEGFLFEDLAGFVCIGCFHIFLLILVPAMNCDRLRLPLQFSSGFINESLGPESPTFRSFSTMMLQVEQRF